VHLKLIACEIFYRELCAAVARSTNQVDIEFASKGLHDIGRVGMSGRLAEILADVDESKYDAVLLGYALCSNGIVGLATKTIPLVVPRAHDCITLFLGSKERYLEYFQNHVGTYFKTSGWIERGDGLAQLGDDALRRQMGMLEDYDALVAKYGEENAQYLQEQFVEMTRNYSQMTYIEMGVEPDDRFERQARDLATEKGWTFDHVQGDMTLLRQLVDGPWDEDRFLVLPPGSSIAPSFTEEIVQIRLPE
jgi:uncharacterized protein DUF1638